MQVLLIVALVALEGYFAAAEIALIRARRAALKQPRRGGLERRADGAQAHGRSHAAALDDPDRHHGRRLPRRLRRCGLARQAGRGVASRSLGMPLLARIAPGLSVVRWSRSLISYVTLVFGELVPKRLGLQRAERVAIAVAGPVTVARARCAPLVWLLTVSTNAVSRLIGPASSRAAARASQRGGDQAPRHRAGHPARRREAHDPRDLRARRHRGARDHGAARRHGARRGHRRRSRHAAEIMQGTGFSRLPVFHDDHDKIVGVVLLKDLVGPLADGGGRRTRHRAHARAGLRARDQGHPAASLGDAGHAQPDGDRRRRVRRHRRPRHAGGHRRGDRRRDRRRVRPRAPLHPAGLGHACASLDGRLSIEEAIERGLPVEESTSTRRSPAGCSRKLGHIPVPGERYDAQRVRVPRADDASPPNRAHPSDRPRAAGVGSGESRRRANRPQVRTRSAAPPPRSRFMPRLAASARRPSPATSSTRTSTCSRCRCMMEMLERPETPAAIQARRSRAASGAAAASRRCPT